MKVISSALFPDRILRMLFIHKMHSNIHVYFYDVLLLTKNNLTIQNILNFVLCL